MTEGHKSVMIPLLFNRKQDGRAYLTVPQIADESGLSIRGTQNVLKEMLEHPAALLASHGTNIWEPLPDRVWIGRAPPCAEAHGDAPKRTGMRDAAPELRAVLNQPSKETKTEIGQDQTGNARIDAAARSELSKRGLVGWPELSLFGQRAFAAGDVAGVLRDLGAGEGLYGQLEDLADLTVAEVMARAAEVGADKTVINKPYSLCWRLAASRGVKLERPEIGRARRMGDEWAELARVRLNKRGRAG